MPAPPLPTPKVIHVNTRGAVILAEESPETRDSRGIYLPNYIEPVSHIAVDIGGSLAKVVYFTRSPEVPPSPSIVATQGSSSEPSSLPSSSAGSPFSSPVPSRSPPIPPSSSHTRNGTLTPLVLESHVNGNYDTLDTDLLRSTILQRTTRVHHIPGGSINFERFETSNISGLITFISELISRSAIANGVSIEEMRRGVNIMATGGGAHKFGELFEKELLVEFRREDEMECLIEGMKFMAMIPEEVYYFSDELISEFSHPGITKCTADAGGTTSSTSANQAALERPSPNPPKYTVTFESGEPSAHLPCLLVNIGSGVSIIKVDADGTFERVSGTSLGGGTLWGLLSLLTPARTFDEMLALSEKGDNATVDMLVGDIYGTDYTKLGLKSTTIASSFGKVFKHTGEGKDGCERGTFKAEDLSRSLLYAVSNNIGQIAYMNAEKYGLDRIYFGGCFIRGHATTITTLSYAIRFWSKGRKRALFLRHEGFLGAIGAWIKNIDAETMQGGSPAGNCSPYITGLPHLLPYSTAFDVDDDRPSVEEEKPSTRRSDKPHDPDNPDKTSSKKPRHRHSPVQLAALNELFDRNEHPSLEERTELAERLGMETKTVNAWFQNKRASTKKRNKTSPVEHSTSATNDSVPPEKSSKQPLPSNLPSIPNLLNSTPPVPAAQLSQHSSRPRSHASSTRRSRQKDLHLNDHILADPHVNVSHSQNNVQEPVLESSFFAGPSEFFSQDRFILSHHRGHDPETGAVPPLHNADSDHMLPDTDSRFVSENDGLPSRRGRNEVARMRTSPEQAEVLRRAYAINDHPTRQYRQQLADRIGMRLQSVTNWFQNQRSQAKKHREESSSTPDVSAHPAQRHPADALLSSHVSHPPLPPRSHHPSLMIPEHDSRAASLKLSSAGGDGFREVSTPRSRMSLPPSLSSRVSSPRIRRSILPYARDPRDLHIDEGRHYDNSSEGTRTEDGLSRPRRSRPEPHQLDALKKLLHRTLTPSIEERSALALEIGMDIGRVTNWFRNVRQNARKRRKRPGASAASTNPHEHDASSGSSVYDDDDTMDLVCEDIVDQEMDERSEEEYQEAVTPFTDVSSSPPPNKRSRSHPPVPDGMEPMDMGLVEPSSAFQEFRKAVGMAPVNGSSDYDLSVDAVTYSGVKIEDALLLLSFHKHVVQ
ncbi:fumble-domain-containing protein [Butyriboletus roseoflavus]|nr:fumble-domain-containing protein [Butyriboletus roseoflavus]